MPTTVTSKISTTNEFSFCTGQDNTNITLLDTKIKIGNKIGLSAAIGNYWTVDEGQHKDVPAFQLKAEYDIGNYFNAALRYRRLGSADQYRVIFGANYDINKHNSISAETQFSLKKSDKWSKSGSISVGHTYTFNNGVEITNELEVGAPLNSDSPSIWHTLGDFKHPDKTWNLKVSVPIFKK